MKVIDINKEYFAEIKDNLRSFLTEHVQDDPETIFHFSDEISNKDKKNIVINSDNFIIERNLVTQICVKQKDENGLSTGFWSMISASSDKSTETNNENDTKIGEDYKKSIESYEGQEIYLKAGRKYYNKLQKYPIESMGIINIMDAKIDFLIKVIKYSFFLNSVALVFAFSRP